MAKKAAFAVAAAPFDKDEAAATAVSTVTAVAEKPHMPDAVVAWLDAQLRETQCFLEYGSGGSTRLAASLNVPRIVSVESDVAYIDAVRDAVTGMQTVSACVMIHANLGETQNWGYPRDFARFRRWPNYTLSAWDYLRKHDLSPDLILIDGRFRVACLLAALLEARPGTPILFDDYDDRKKLYGAVERILSPTRLIDRSAIFTVPETLDLPVVARALARFINIPD